MKLSPRFSRPIFLSASLCCFVALLSEFTSLAGTVPASAQEPEKLPEPGNAVERELSGGQSHQYLLVLSTGDFVTLAIEQRGINVRLELLAPDGSRMLEMDDHKAITGTEELLFVAESAGAYRLSVGAAVSDAVAGKYQINLKEKRPAAEKDYGSYAALLAQHADKQAGKNALEAALQLLQRALTMQEKATGAEHPEYARLLNSTGVLFFRKREAKRAAELLERALVIRERSLGADDLQTAATVFNLATVYREAHDLKRAESYFKRVLEIREKKLKANDPQLIQALNALAAVYGAKGEYAKAIPLYERALIGAEKLYGNEKPEFITALFSLAGAYTNNGEYVKAETLLERALEITVRLRGEAHLEVAAAKNALGLVSSRRGNYQRAEQLYQSALAIRQQKLKPDDPLIALSLNNLAGLYLDLRKHQEAVPLYEQALAIREKTMGAKHPLTARVLSNLSVVYQELGELEKAEPLYQRILTIQEETLGRDHPEVGTVLHNLAVLELLQKNYEESEKLFLRALSIRETKRGAHHPEVAKTLDNLSVLYDLKGDIGKAEQLRRRGLEIRESNLALILAAGTEAQKRDYLATLNEETDITISFSLNSARNNAKAADLALETVLRRKGRVLDALTDSLGTLRMRLEPQDQKLLDELSAVRARLAGLILSGRAGTEAQAEVAKLEAEQQRIESAISSRSSAFQSDSTAIKPEQLQTLLPPKSALVEFTIYRPFDRHEKIAERRFGMPRYAAFILKPQSAPVAVDLGEADVIDRTAARLRQALGDPKRKDTMKLARAFDNQVMRPVRKLLKNTSRVLLSPEGSLNLIPFAALVDEHKNWLVSRYEFSYLTSGRDLIRLQARRPASNHDLIIANPDFGVKGSSGQATSRKLVMEAATSKASSFYAKINAQPLPGTAQEARAISRLFPQATMLTGQEATKMALKRAAKPRILHIATHGYFLEAATIQNPLLRSGLIFAGANQSKSKDDDDGVLTALEASGLDLWGTRLVVLSACDTGVGEVKAGDGVFGLRRALVLAGAESQVMSLWPVSDIGTRDLMIDYYRGLQHGQGRSKALRNVQLRLIRLVNRRHPYYWAGFIQSGEWKPLTNQ